MNPEVSSTYEAVIGLEVHAQLQTQSKLFCADPAGFGAEPNTHISAITLAYPGTLPVLNQAAVEMAVKLGLACGCTIATTNYFARKHYFYPDLPKGYQLSQHTTPICKGGRVKISTSAGERWVRLNRIHLEEDAGKSMHDQYNDFSVVDYNRAGVPLVEIVTEPDLHTAEEAAAYFAALRQLVRTLGVCDGNMEEGSLRCDANISVRRKGDSQLGTKVEVKNLNSIRFLRKAIEYEVERMIHLLEAGQPIRQQTRSFDATTETTFAIRDKEEANDYRYMPDPDVPPFVLTPEYIEQVRQTLPELPDERKERLMRQYALPAYDATILSADVPLCDYFEAAARITPAAKQVANWLLGPVKSYLNEAGMEMEAFPLPPHQLAAIIDLVEAGSVSHTAAVQKLFPAMLQNPDATPAERAAQLNLLQERNADTLRPLVEAVLAAMPDKVQEYKKGKKGLMGLFVGAVMKRSGGKADPRLLNEILNEFLSKP